MSKVMHEEKFSVRNLTEDLTEAFEASCRIHDTNIEDPKHLRDFIFTILSSLTLRIRELERKVAS